MLIVIASTLSSCSTQNSANGAPAVNAKATFTAHGSDLEAYVLGAKPNEKLTLVDNAGKAIANGVADRLGSFIFRNLNAGPGYYVKSQIGAKVYGTSTFAVLDPNVNPPESFYSAQHMQVGLNYIKMRDGVTLAATLRLPPGKTLADGPFPTVIEYSGYATAAPGNLLNQLLGQKQTGNLPAPDSATVVGSLLAPILGFASVSLQMRGTGCSGGAFDLFGQLTTTDGYDAVQIVSSQPFVKNHKVGLVGISFSGISQLFVAGDRPPGLAAIAPMSPTNDLYQIGFPGGIMNNGFAQQWEQQRVADSKPAPGGGQPWATQMIDLGDKTCLSNQALHLQILNIDALMSTVSHRDPSLYDIRSPDLWASNINVPVFIAGQFQDEETGGQIANILTYLKNDPHVFATLDNGTHVDSMGPGVLIRWLEFLDIYVADEVPSESPLFLTIASQMYNHLTGSQGGTLPPMRFTNAPNVTTAKAEFEQQTPRVNVLFDNGGNALNPGIMDPLWSQGFSSWPPTSEITTSYYLGPTGTLSTTKPSTTSSLSYNPNPDLVPRTDLPSGNAWAALPPYKWLPTPSGAGLGFITKPFSSNMTVVGPASLNLWIKSSAPDTDVQVDVTEVLPNGQEMYVQSGWLRASDRSLDSSKSTALHPVPTYLASTASPLPANVFTEIRVPILPIGFAFRAGSRLRIVISAPGDDRPAWAFKTFETYGKVKDTVEIGPAGESALVLPVVPGITPLDSQPPCPSNRGEPCRIYVPESNGG
ncbi:MAG: CocE/NonD family hydrolase [Acidimicrobiales bacterium]|nr:CocE/NonD family hydrolase [Acidimicrobiales bacterium]